MAVSLRSKPPPRNATDNRANPVGCQRPGLSNQTWPGPECKLLMLEVSESRCCAYSAETSPFPNKDRGSCCYAISHQSILEQGPGRPSNGLPRRRLPRSEVLMELRQIIDANVFAAMNLDALFTVLDKDKIVMSDARNSSRRTKGFSLGTMIRRPG